MKIKCDVIMPIIFSDWGQNIELFCIWWNVIKTLLRELNWIASVTQKFYCTYINCMIKNLPVLLQKMQQFIDLQNFTVTETFFLLVYLQMCNGTWVYLYFLVIVTSFQYCVTLNILSFVQLKWSIKINLFEPST